MISFVSRTKAREYSCLSVVQSSILLLLMVCVPFGLCLTDAALASGTQSSTSAILLNVQEAIEVVNWPDASITLSSVAMPGQPVVSGALRFTVKCNASWGIQVKSDEAAGKMREFNVGTATYVTDGRTSQKSLEWGTSAAGPWTALSGTHMNIVTSMLPTGETGSDVSMYLRYTPGFNDVPLTGDRIYRSVLTYTAAVGY